MDSDPDFPLTPIFPLQFLTPIPSRRKLDSDPNSPTPIPPQWGGAWLPHGMGVHCISGVGISQLLGKILADEEWLALDGQYANDRVFKLERVIGLAILL
jgi:hypothetical protein